MLDNISYAYRLGLISADERKAMISEVKSSLQSGNCDGLRDMLEAHCKRESSSVLDEILTLI